VDLVVVDNNFISSLVVNTCACLLCRSMYELCLGWFMLCWKESCFSALIAEMSILYNLDIWEHTHAFTRRFLYNITVLHTDSALTKDDGYKLGYRASSQLQRRKDVQRIEITRQQIHTISVRLSTHDTSSSTHQNPTALINAPSPIPTSQKPLISPLTLPRLPHTFCRIIHCL